jgi:alpha-beta hydrolase superfamily lysophospholipase/phosphatidylglycerophosphate synthase/SAM-dependent methyltransferase
VTDASFPYQPTSRRPIADTFRATARGAVNLCVRLNVHPDVVSYASIIAAAVAGACFLFAARHPWLLLAAPAFMYLRLWLNMLDGMVALASGKASLRGEILNELPDRVSDVLIFTAVAHSGLCQQALGYQAAIMALMTAYVGMLGQAVGAEREFGGVMSKPWRMVSLHVGAWVTYFMLLRRSQEGLLPTIALDVTCWVVIVGCVQTVAVRLVRTFAILRGKTADTVCHGQPAACAPPSSRQDAGGQAASNTQTSSGSVNDDPTGIRPFTAHTFVTHDGVELFYRAWLPAHPTTKAILLFHRGHEHSARWQDTVDRLNVGDDVAIFAWDQRGHGRSPGERGSAQNLAVVIRDAEFFSRHVETAHGVKLEDTVVFAHSVGAVVATAWIHDYAPRIRGLVLAAPALRVKLYVPFAVPFLRLKQKLLGPGCVKSYVKAKMLTRDKDEAAKYAADHRIFRQIAVNILLDLHDTSTRLLADAGAITTPTLVLAAGDDWVVRTDAQWRFFERLSSPVKQMELYPELRHAMFHDVGRERVVDRISTFVRECFASSPSPDSPSFLHADKGGYTKTEYDRLRGPDGVRWSIARFGMNTFCQLSDGMRLGKRAGYDSGVMLDYVYANEPHGITPLGRMIDRDYLNSIGWRGIRVRRQNLERLLRETITTVHASGQPVHILDIAAGAGRYVLETMKALPDVPSTAVLRDYQQANLDAASKRAREIDLSDRVTILHADAFDRASIANTDPKPTIAIVSGLYELFPENEPLTRSLGGLADVVAPGGFLIYTCQPWHPQVEFIARTLTNREGNPWIMRRRTQREMDEIVRSVGFEKVEQAIDEWGIFTVSVARRRD